MGWFRSRKSRRESTIHSEIRRLPGGETAIDVRGQTCPGYLLAINKAMGLLQTGTEAHLLVDYPPCGDDVKAWADEKGHAFLGFTEDEGFWRIRVRK
ncbi:MAG TPA: sulfurtransferase TusA family protein [Gammaproteobacteria bacterium]|nr:sulfurtransferase TusA family protein [Gammaproteobacteria bacterium]